MLWHTRYSSSRTWRINSIRDFSCAFSRVPLYDLIATHGKMSERIDETKRSGGMKMGAGETGGRRGEEEGADTVVGAEG